MSAITTVDEVLAAGQWEIYVCRDCGAESDMWHLMKDHSNGSRGFHNPGCAAIDAEVIPPDGPLFPMPERWECVVVVRKGSA